MCSERLVITPPPSVRTEHCCSDDGWWLWCILHTLMYTAHCTAHCTEHFIAYRTAYWSASYTIHSNAHSNAQCTVHSTAHCTAHFYANCTLHFTLYCTKYCTLQTASRRLQTAHCIFGSWGMEGEGGSWVLLVIRGRTGLYTLHFIMCT